MPSRFATLRKTGSVLARRLVPGATPIAAPVGLLILASVVSAQEPATGSTRFADSAPSVNAPLAIPSRPRRAEPAAEPAVAPARSMPPIDAPAPSAAEAAPRSGGPVTPVSATERLPLGPLPPASAAASSLPGASADGSDGESSGWLPSFLDPRRSAAARTLGSLALVLALAWVVVSLLRRTSGPFAGGRRPSGVVQVLARYPVGRGQSVLLLQVGRRVLCVHQAAGNMRTLADIADRDEVADLVGRIEGQDRSAFVAMLNGAAGRLEREVAAPSSGARARPARPAVAPVVETIDLTRSRAGLVRLLAGRQAT